MSPLHGIHTCQSPPIVVLGNGGPGHQCACPPAPSASHWRPSICWPPAPGAHRFTSHWQPSICWQPMFHIIFVAGKLLYGLRHRVPVAPSHTACFQGMSTCHQRPGLSTVCHKRQYFSVSYFFYKCNSFTIADDSTDQRETKLQKAREKYASMLGYKKGKLMQRDEKVISAERSFSE